MNSIIKLINKTNPAEFALFLQKKYTEDPILQYSKYVLYPSEKMWKYEYTYGVKEFLINLSENFFKAKYYPAPSWLPERSYLCYSKNFGVVCRVTKKFIEENDYTTIFLLKELFAFHNQKSKFFKNFRKDHQNFKEEHI